MLYPVYATTRRRAQASARVRTRLIVRGVLGILTGAVLTLVLPSRVPETPGSPSTIVALLLLWIGGGTLALLSAVALAGAIPARPEGP